MHGALKVGAIVALFIVGSLAVGLTPSLTKSASILAGVGERISIDSVYPVYGETYTDISPANPSMQIVQLGGEHFEWSFIIHVGDRAEAKAVVRNDGGGAAMVKVNCSVPNGLEFVVLTGDQIAPSQTVRLSVNAYAAEIRSGATKDFRIIYKGLAEGDYQVSCTISDMGGVGGPHILQNTVAPTPALNSLCTGPFGEAWDRSNGYVYVTCMFDDSVKVIDGSTNGVVATVTTNIGTLPSGIAYDSKENRLFVANAFDNTLSVIDGSSNAVVQVISSASFNVPIGVAYDSTDGKVFVANSGSNTVTVVDAASYAVGPSVTVGNDPFGIAYDSIHDRVYVADFGSGFGNSVSVIDGATDALVATVTVDLGPLGVAFDLSSGNVFVTCQGPDKLDAIDGATGTVIAGLALSKTPYGETFDSGDGNVYTGITDGVAPSVSVNEDSTGRSIANVLLPTIPAPGVPYGIVFDPVNGDIYVANFGQNSVTVIETV